MAEHKNGAAVLTTTPQESLRHHEIINNSPSYKGFEDVFNEDLDKAENHFKQSQKQPSFQAEDSNPTKADYTPEYLEQLLKTNTLDHSQKIELPPIAIEIQGTKGNSIISTLGNFLAIIGKAKSRKTFLVSLFIAAFIANRVLMDKIKCYIHGNNNKIVLFDTEQSTYHVQKVLQRILATAEVTRAPDFELVCLRTIPPKLRLAAIKHKIYNTPSLSIAVIDGIKDLVFDINDGKEATEITTELMKWSEETNIHIIVVLHQNKGDNNARGHLGTEVVNKAETVISVTKDTDNPDLSIVTPEYCREKEFEPFAFSVDQKGQPYIVTDWIHQQSKDGKKTSLTANSIPAETHIKILKEIFSKASNPTYSELLEQIILGFEVYGIPFKRNKAVSFCTYYANQKWILKSKKEGRTYSVYQLSPSV